jgi:branched-chain amino acid transport system substrate-binding protein
MDEKIGERRRDMKISRRRMLLSTATVSLVAGSFGAAWAQGTNPVRIGFTASQSGALASMSKTVLLAREIWRDDINARGGLLGRPVELVFYDDQSNSSVSPGLYSKLIDVDKVDILFGPYGTPLFAPVMPMLKQRDLLIMGIFCTWANEALKHDKYFHMAPYGSGKSEFQAGFTKLAARKGVKSIAILASDTEGTLVWADMSRNAARRLGVQIVYDQKYPYNSIDFSSIMRAIDATRPESVYIAAYAPETSAILHVMEELGIGDDYKLFGGGLIGLQAGPLLQSLGERVNGIVNFNTYVPDLEFKGTKSFFETYRSRAKKAGIDVLGLYVAPFAFAQGQVLEQAVNGTKSLDGATLAKYMHQSEFDTIVGKFRFGPTGEWTEGRVLVTQFQGVKGNDLEQFERAGTQVILEPEAYVTGELIMPYGKARR